MPRQCSRPRVSSSNRLADVAGDPAGGVEAHGLRARQCREVIFDPVKFGGAIEMGLAGNPPG
jgi:hypothetical protein